mmetsp:Transcript_2306/g.4492  ORF Transcript_2306/g.4492 Transcript_2306/m.4492 type:complete len:440 (+) Transcript_2306:1417-2736(+)|eukprot:CAMPEP_0203748130 /NCGR_PEP_ID=MMETSP0098-20131031/3087_1 /ASSEMBLY_ACC=CAM_ASM_000208 /TAXON_ID=96639 /ORGANISM=" , Strain NY0313808BC1" /LENGTH=439 /DNA_ID=CAMNT_0050636761 /DNA_START=1318 /DNA_END=2637 /DNA_ORIENTATION=+
MLTTSSWVAVYTAVLLVLSDECGASGAMKDIPAKDPRIVFEGRRLNAGDKVFMDWPCVKFSITATGLKKFGLNMNGGNNKFQVIASTADRTVAWTKEFATNNKTKRYEFDFEFSPREQYTIVVQKLNEASYFLNHILKFPGYVKLESVIVNTESILNTQDYLARKKRRIEVFGDSDANGYGILGESGKWYDELVCFWTGDIENQNCALAWPTLLAERLNAELSLEAWSGKGVVQDAIPGFVEKYGWLIQFLDWGFDPGFNAEVMPTYWNRSLAVHPSHYGIKSFSNEENTHVFSTSVPELVIVYLGSNDYFFDAPNDDVFVSGFVGMLENIIGSYARNVEDRLVIVTLCGGLTPDRTAPCPNVAKATHIVESMISARGMSDISIEYISIPADEDLNTFGCQEHRNAQAHLALTEFLLPRIRSIMHWDNGSPESPLSPML